MSDYPILFHSKAIKALVIGAGNVGLRKTETLLSCGVQNITLLDRKKPENFPYQNNICVRFLEKSFESSDLDGHNLVFVASNNKELNSLVADFCHKKNILCNVASHPEEGDFVLPAIVKKGDIMLTLSTGGNSPALAKALKEEGEALLNKGYVELCDFLGKLRPKLLALGYSSEENALCFRAFVTSPLKEKLLPLFAKNTPEAKKEIYHYLCAQLSREFLRPMEELLC